MKASSLIILSWLLAVLNASCEDAPPGAENCPLRDPADNTICCAWAEVCSSALCPPTTTGAPITTVTAVETTCVCPSYPQQTISPDIKNAGGTCTCEKGEVNGIRVGVTELRFVYYGRIAPNADPVGIELFRREKEGGVTICKFDSVVPNQEIRCALDGTQPGLVLQGLADFDNETPFVITYSDGSTCSASYHTSCSSDIVNVVLAECTDLVCTGWNDGSGQNCDDGIEPCPCNNPELPPYVPEPTTWVDIILGDNCYCDTSGQIVVATPAPKSKAKKSKGKKGGGLGVGDCDCEGGQIEFTLLYQWAETVTIEWWYFDKKTGDDALICVHENVAQGDESTCNVQQPMQCDGGTCEVLVGAPVHDKLGKNTFVSVTGTVSGDQCQTDFHTSCSQDIVGEYGGTDCGVIVSHWRDGNNVADGGWCDDGFESCPCNGTFVEAPPDPVSEPKTQEGDTCYCSVIDVDAFTTTDSPVTTMRPQRRRMGKKSKGRATGYGWGDCECKGGVWKLSFGYKGAGPADITLFADGLDSEVICTREQVMFGEENDCSIREGPLDSVGDPYYFKMQKETFVRVTSASGVCEGQWHTSCSQDIVGWTAVGCEDVVISGWNGIENGRCDNGYELCDCTDCTPFSIVGDPSPCEVEPNCYVDENTDTCEFSGQYYTGKGGANSQNIFMTVVVVVAAIAYF